MSVRSSADHNVSGSPLPSEPTIHPVRVHTPGAPETDADGILPRRGYGSSEGLPAKGATLVPRQFVSLTPKGFWQRETRRSVAIKLRFDHGVLVSLFGVLLTICLLGQGAGEGVRLLATAPGIPLGNGTIIFLIVVVVILNAIFVAAEAAVDLVKPYHVRHVKEENRFKSDRLQDLMENKTRYATACTLASRVARIALILLIVLLATSFGLDEARGARGSFDLSHFLRDLVLVAIPVSLVNLIAGELVPKSFASLHPHRTGLRLYRVIRGASVVFSVPASILVGIANLATRTFGGKASFTLPNQAEEEIRTIVESAQETGEIEDEEKELLTSVFEFSDTVAREVMTPRVDVDAMPVSSKPEEVVRVMRESGHSRIPLYEDTDDQIVGIVHAKDLLMAMVDNGSVSVRSLMRPALFVPEGKNLHDLLREMRLSRSQMAVVQDEFGGTAGIVTIEDIVEELVGDIVDEYDEEEEIEPDVVETGTGGFLVDGKARLDEVNDEIGSKFESEEFDTVGGYVFGLFGRQPKQSEQIDDGAYRFQVVDTDGRRIAKLHIEPIPHEAELDFEEE
jgi:magnesium and cobalt exporter, CNNM family